MQTISIPDMIDMVQHVCVRNQEPAMFWGKPGVGKSEGVKAALARVLNDLGVPFSGELYEAEGCERLVDIRLSQYDSVDLRGIPSVDRDYMVATEGQVNEALTTWAKPSTMPFKGNARFVEDKIPIFMFLDEINGGTPATLAVAYQLVNEKRVGEHKLMDNVIVIAAGNREQDRGVTNRMPTPLANRFTHAEIDVDVDAWCFWAQAAGLPAEGIAFMQFRKPLLSTFDPSKPDKAFATPRSWQKALKYFADAGMPEHTKSTAMAGAVGEGPFAEFFGFVDVWQKMPKMTDIVANPTTVPVPEEAAMRYAVAVAISGTMNPKNVGPLCTYLERMDPEFAVLTWQLAMRRDVTISGTNECIKFAKQYREIFAR